MPTCSLCGEENPPNQPICRRCRSTLTLGRAGAIGVRPAPAAPARAPAGGRGEPPELEPELVELPDDDVLDFGPSAAEQSQALKASRAVPQLEPDLLELPEELAELAPGAGGPVQDLLPVPLPVQRRPGAARPVVPAAPPAERHEAPDRPGGGPPGGREQMFEAPLTPTPLALDLAQLDGQVAVRARAREEAARADEKRNRGARRDGAGPAPVAEPDLVIGAPPLPPLPELPELVSALPPSASGSLARIRYGIAAPGVARLQRRQAAQLGTFLARAKRHEIVAIASLGRAARKHRILPAEAVELAEAAELEERRAREKGEKADVKQAEERRADQAARATRERAAARLLELEDRHAPLAARLAELRKRLEGSEALVAELRGRVEELRALADAEPTPEELGGDIEVDGERIVVKTRSRDEEVGRRAAALHAGLCELAALEKTVRQNGEQAAALGPPIAKAEAEMERERQEVRRAEAQLEAATAEARVAEVSRERRAAYADRSVSELDEETGRILLRLEQPPAALGSLLALVAASRGRVAEIESALNGQQDELEVYDRKLVASGWRRLVLCSLGLVAALLALGEGLRRLVLVLGE